MLRAVGLCLCLASASARPAVSSAALRPSRASLLALRGGSEPSGALLQATYACNALFSSVLDDAKGEVAALRKVVSGGEAVASFGSKADELVADAVAKFQADAPKAEGDVASLYESKAEDLAEALRMCLEPVFVQQLCLLKDAALEQFKKVAAQGEGDATEALTAAEAAFVREAGESVPSKTGWGYKIERQSLVGSMQAILQEQKKAHAAKLQTSTQMQTALSYLQVTPSLTHTHRSAQ